MNEDGLDGSRDRAQENLKLREGDQQLPIVNESESIQSLVISDLEARTQVGIQRYGTALQPFNGRDAMRDAYEEALDLAVYLKQCIVERDAITAQTEARERVDKLTQG